MKRFFFIRIVVIIAIVGVSSCKSNEQKAEALIKDYMFKHLHDYASYEVVETKVDSAYNTLFDNLIMSNAFDVIEMKEECDDLEDDVEYAKDIMNVWDDSSNPYVRSRYNEARKEYITKYREYVESNLNYVRGLQGIRHRMDTLNREFIGWIVSHSYRCNTSGGNSVLSNDYFLVDKKFKTIMNTFEEEELADLMRVIDLARYPTTERMDSLVNVATETYNIVESAYNSIQ